MEKNILSLNNNTPPSREDYAYEAIKEAILSGELLPNQKISLSGLARDLRVSIIPVNNAVRRLTSEGLITQDPHHSPFVNEFSSETLNEVLTIRYHLEKLALREAIPNIGPKEIKELQEIVDELDIAIQENDMHQYGILNRALHMKIYSYGPFPMLCEMINDLWNKAELNRCRSVFALVPHMAEHSQGEHIEMLHLIENKDVEAVIEVLNRHKNYSRGKLFQTLEKIES